MASEAETLKRMLDRHLAGMNSMARQTARTVISFAPTRPLRSLNQAFTDDVQSGLGWLQSGAKPCGATSTVARLRETEAVAAKAGLSSVGKCKRSGVLIRDWGQMKSEGKLGILPNG